MSRTIAIIQQRLGNTRLKNKALLPLCGIPMTQHIVDRCKRAKLVNEVVVACPFKDAIVLGEALDATIVAPDVPENDLIARYYTVAKGMGADVAIQSAAITHVLSRRRSMRFVALLVVAWVAWSPMPNILILRCHS